MRMRRSFPLAADYRAPSNERLLPTAPLSEAAGSLACRIVHAAPQQKRDALECQRPFVIYCW